MSSWGRGALGFLCPCKHWVLRPASIGEVGVLSGASSHISRRAGQTPGPMPSPLGQPPHLILTGAARAPISQMKTLRLRRRYSQQVAEPRSTCSQSLRSETPPRTSVFF